jgi:hypothetical protein
MSNRASWWLAEAPSGVCVHLQLEHRFNVEPTGREKPKNTANPPKWTNEL